MLAAIALAGCAAGPDLAGGGGLSAEDTAACNTIAELIPRRCVRVSQVYSTGEQLGPQQKIAKATVRRLFKSPTGWYKAEFQSANLIDFVYWHKLSGRMVCGEGSWGTLAGQAGVRFEEVVASAAR